MSNAYQFSEQIGHLLRRAYQRHMAIFQETVPDSTLTPSQFVVLCTVRDHQSCEVGAIAAATALDEPSVRGIVERLETWIHRQQAPALTAVEAPMEPELAEAIYELDRCIECGCCVAGCGTLRMREDFVGAVGLNKIARFRLDPRDERSDEDFYNLIGDDTGVFGCMSLLGCHDVCPKGLPLQTQIAFLRRKMAVVGLK